jgi:hypothetical protein
VVKSIVYEPSIQAHYNVHFKDGSKASKVQLRAISGLRPVDIDWIWVVEERRRAAPSEIRKLCKLSHENI